MIAKKKPIEVKVARWHGKLPHLVDVFGTEIIENVFFDVNENLHIQTLEGNFRVAIGDVIVQGVAGEFYSIKWDLFVQTYEIRLPDNITADTGYYRADIVNW